MKNIMLVTGHVGTWGWVCYELIVRLRIPLLGPEFLLLMSAGVVQGILLFSYIAKEVDNQICSVAQREARRDAMSCGKIISAVYTQRNVAAIVAAKLAILAGCKAGTKLDDNEGKDVDAEWRHVVYIDLPDGQQISWHMAPNEVELLDVLPKYEGVWDGTFNSSSRDIVYFDMGKEV